MEPNETVILVAEDEAVVRNLVRLMLSKEGYAVLTANDGQEAVRPHQADQRPQADLARVRAAFTIMDNPVQAGPTGCPYGQRIRAA